MLENFSFIIFLINSFTLKFCSSFFLIIKNILCAKSNGKLRIAHSNNVLFFVFIINFGLLNLEFLNLFPSPPIGMIKFNLIPFIFSFNLSAESKDNPKSSIYISACGFPKINSSYFTLFFFNQSFVILPTFFITSSTLPLHVRICLPVWIII